MSESPFYRRDSRGRCLSRVDLTRFRGPPRTFVFKEPTMEAPTTLHYLALGRRGLGNPRRLAISARSAAVVGYCADFTSALRIGRFRPPLPRANGLLRPIW